MTTAFASPGAMEAARLLELVGGTPVTPVRLVVDGRPRVVHLKLEGANPTGSIKVRTALALVQNVERRGLAAPGSLLVESSSGNLGAALALVAKARGYGLLVVVDPKTSPENIAKIRSFGADVEVVTEMDETGGYLLSRLRRVEELIAATPGAVWPDQYGNEANPLAHATGTGPELFRQMEGRIDAVFAAVSTCGTLAGLARYLRQASPRTRIVAVDAVGSVVFGGPARARRLTGIGASREPSFALDGCYDETEAVADEEAFAACRALRDGAGVSVGGSAGAVLVACARWLARNPDARRVACVCADTGENYATSIFSDGWLAQHGLALPAGPPAPIEDIEPWKGWFA